MNRLKNEFTEISWGKGALGYSTFEGMTRRCNGFRAMASCANEGRRLGSLGMNPPTGN